MKIVDETMNDQPTTQGDCNQRPFQFRPRAFLIVVAVVGTFLGFAVITVKRHQSQREAAAELQQLDATVGLP